MYREPLYTDEKGKVIQIWDPAVNVTLPVQNNVHSRTSSVEVTKSVEDLPIRYMQFNQNIEMIPDPFVERFQFWKSLGMTL